MLKATLADLAIEAGPDELVLTLLEYPRTKTLHYRPARSNRDGKGNCMIIRIEMASDCGTQDTSRTINLIAYRTIN